MFHANQQIGNYTLLRQIGRGGFGEVWLAERRTEILTTRVAIKLPHREQVNLEAIRQEAQLWAKASGHSNILPIIEANIYDGQIVIVSEYAPDGSLDEKLQLEIPIKQTLEIVIGILSGLDFLHTRQIIHRDIKPANILLQGETPRLADFGISRIIKATAVSTAIVGTPKYMAPEAFDGKRSGQTDIWSVGVILYQMLCHDVPFRQENPTELMWAIVTKEPEPLPESVVPDLRRIVQKALAKLPENRFQSAREMREELQRALLNISYPAFAPTEVLEKKPIDLQTIEDKSMVTEIPKTNVLVEESKNSVVTRFVDKTVKQNELEANIPTEYKPILPTIPAANPQLPVTDLPTVPQITEVTNDQKQNRGFHWGFYFLPLLVDLVARVTTFNLSYKLFSNIIGSSRDLYDLNTKRIFYFELPMDLVIYGLFGFLFGFIFPGGKWKWGVFLNVGFMLTAIFVAPPNQWLASIILVSITTLAACLTSSLGERLSPRKPAEAFAKTPEKWTAKRIIRWIFYFLSPIIGFLVMFLANKISHILMAALPPMNDQPYETQLMILITLYFIAYGIIGGLLGYIFPEAGWRWGLLLNLVVLVIIGRNSMAPFHFAYKEIFILEILLFLIPPTISSLTSYIGSWLASWRTENKEIAVS